MEDQIRTLSRALSTMREIRLAYLFGQRVNGGAGDLSEFGVAVYLNRRCPAFDRRVGLMERLADVLETTAFDFVVLNDAPIMTNRTIARYGMVVKDDPKAREAFQTKLHQVGSQPAPATELFWSFPTTAGAAAKVNEVSALAASALTPQG